MQRVVFFDCSEPDGFIDTGSVIIGVGFHDERRDAPFFKSKLCCRVDESAADALAAKVGVGYDVLEARQTVFVEEAEVAD